MKLKASLYDENALGRAIMRIAHEIVENNESVDRLCLVGIKTRGIPFARRLSEAIEKIENKKIPVFQEHFLETVLVLWLVHSLAVAPIPPTVNL